MLKKKYFWRLLFLVLLAAGVVYLFRYYKELPKSKILVKKTVETVLEDGSRVIKIPIAALPKREDNPGEEVLLGKVIRAPNNPDDNKSNEMMAINTGKEVIVLSNLIYVRSLEYFYLGKDVRLSGKWRKNAMIYGRSYRSFWIEDIELNDKQNNRRAR
jgi:hypothetical protein